MQRIGYVDGQYPEEQDGKTIGTGKPGPIAKRRREIYIARVKAQVE